MRKWFRRKDAPPQEQAPVEAAAPPVPTDLPEPPADETAEAKTDPRKRRRSGRGGRGRKRTPATTTAEAAPAKPARKQPERKPAERKPKAAPRSTTPRRRAIPKRAPLPQAKRELLVSVDVGEQRVAVLEDGRVAEVYLERPERRSIAGNVYKGVVDNVLPGMEAAFIEIGLEKNGFLYVDEIVGAELEGRRRGERRIQDLLSRGQEILVQAVKDPMKSKGARLTTDISLPGRFVVYVPQGEGLGVSRRLEDDERNRLKDIVKSLKVKQGGVIVRTAAEGASAEDVERDLAYLQKLWKDIQARAKTAKAPALVYQEAELPLRVTRDLFTGDFERALVDNDRAFKRIVGYLKKTSPHMVERVVRYKEKAPMMEEFGVEQDIRSTLSRRVDLPSGGYLVFDYAEAFTVIDVNTGRFVGSRGKSGGGRLEDTITKNNLEAVKEVVRQLRLRDVGGIIVIDFIDMANPKNRAAVEEALRSELERDRTKTYVVEISPLGLVEMTRQNVTDGPREILTRKCPTCDGDGIVYSDQSVAIDIERKLRELAAKPRVKAFRIETNARIAALVVGPAAERLSELEALTKKRFFLVGKPDVHADHFALLEEGTLENVRPEAPPVEEDAEVELKLVEVGLYDPNAAVAKLDGFAVVVAGAAKLVGKKVKARVVRVLDGVAYASLVEAPAKAKAKAEAAPLTAEAEAEKPTRASRAKKEPAKPKPTPKPAAKELAEAAVEEEAALAEAEPPEEEEAEAGEETAAAAAARKRRRRGTRGGRGRKRKTVETAAEGAADEEPAEAAAETKAAPRIHVPAPDLGAEGESEAEPEEPAGEEEATEAAKKRRRRGTRGGRGRRRKPVAADAAETNGGESAEEAREDFEYVPMSEWIDDVESGEGR